MKKYLNLSLGLLIVSVIYSSIYTVSQQVLRLGANDPQIQIAEDSAAVLDRGVKPEQLVNGRNINISSSLATFIIIYDKSGKVVAGSGYLDGSVPTVPLGVLVNSKGKKDGNRVTWQPANGVRIASVTVAGKDYYVLAGRNMREVESREAEILKIATLSWLFTIALVAVGYKLKTIDRKPEKKLSHDLHKR